MADEKTTTVRIAKTAALKLQTIDSMLREMGEPFSTVEYLNGLVVRPIEELHRETASRHSAFLKRNAKK